MPTSPEADTYPMPEHGWTCFHCGATFTNVNLARDHFGRYPVATPACQLSPDHVREELRRYRFQEAKLHDIRERLAVAVETSDHFVSNPPEPYSVKRLARTLDELAIELLDAACGA